MSVAPLSNKYSTASSENSLIVSADRGPYGERALSPRYM